jgi:two-component system, NtrC family, nitrogen regulation sensor histidine kinase NtrY
MTLQRLFIAYLLLVHIVVGGVLFWLVQEQTLWLLYVEIGLLFSLILSVWLLSRFFAPLRMLASGADLLKESDFSNRLVLTGQQEMDKLISVYNTMLTILREERIKAQEQRHLLSSIVEQSPTGILICDFDGRVSNMNPSAEALLGKSSMHASIGELPEPFAQIMTILAMLPSRQYHSEVVSLGIRRVRCTRIEFFDRGFARSAFLLDEMTEELRRSEKSAYDKLIRIFAHEINNSMGAVRSILQSLGAYTPQLSPDDREDAEAALNIAIDRTSSLATFIRAYADIVRLPAPNLASCDIQALMLRVTDILTPLATTKRISWEWRTHSATFQVFVDKTQMEQALLNILKNAIEASIEERSIIIELIHKDNQVIVRVENIGKQIQPDVQTKLFTPFFTTKVDGQGIGLMLVRDILTAHDIGFTLENTSTGACFTMTLQFEEQ